MSAPFRLSVSNSEETLVKTTLLCVLAFGATALAGAASADDSGTITVQSHVAAYCSSLPSVASSQALGELADGNGQLVHEFATPVEISAATYLCNAPTTVTLATTPLMNADVPVVADASSFTNRVDFTAAWSWGAASAAKSSIDPDSVTSVPTAQTGPLSITAHLPVTDQNKRPVAGPYAGSITLTVAPQS